jgi:hypothetical protein
MTDIFSENGHLTESTFDKKCHLPEKKNCAQGRLTENSFDQNFFRKMVICPKGQLTECSFGRKVI